MPRTLADDRVRGVLVDADVEMGRLMAMHAAGMMLSAGAHAHNALAMLGTAANHFDQAEPNCRYNRAGDAVEVAKIEVAVRALADRWAGIADRLAQQPAVEPAAAKPEQVAA